VNDPHSPRAISTFKVTKEAETKLFSSSRLGNVGTDSAIACLGKKPSKKRKNLSKLGDAFQSEQHSVRSNCVKKVYTHMNIQVTILIKSGIESGCCCALLRSRKNNQINKMLKTVNLCGLRKHEFVLDQMTSSVINQHWTRHLWQ